MKTIKKLTVLVIIALLLGNTACKLDILTKTKYAQPTVSDVSHDAASFSTEILEVGSDLITYGHCYGTSNSPTIDDDKTIKSVSTAKKGVFTEEISGLQKSTTYFVRAYAEEDGGILKYSKTSEAFSTTNGLPEVETINVTNTDYTSAISGGNVISEGSSAVIARGVCWSKNQNPTIDDNHTTNGTGEGEFVSNLTNLTEYTTYYVKAYATNSEETAYGEEESFKTREILPPTVTNLAESNVAYTTATMNGQVNANDFDATVTFEYGETTSYGNTINATPEIVTGNTNTSVHADLIGLKNNQVYHYRVKAVNSGGIIYGEDDISFTTSEFTKPLVTTNSVNDKDYTTATCGGNVTDEGSSSVTARGVCWSTSLTPTIDDSKTIDGSGLGTFTSSLTGLINNTDYFVRAYATNNEGTSYGLDETFKTLAYTMPTVTTDAITNVTYESASSGGNVTDDGGDPVTARGVCWSTSTNPTTANSKTDDGAGTGTFSSSLTNLAASSTYYVKAFATNSVGTAYGSEEVFTTADAPNITITAPISSNDWLGGSTQEITWSDNIAGNVDIELYKNNIKVVTYGDIVLNTQSDGGYSWVISTKLLSGTDYFVRITSVDDNSVTDDSEQFTITAIQVTDYDENVYAIVTIGNQRWMKQNLKVTHYFDGTVIPNITVDVDWGNLLDDNFYHAYCYFDNNSVNGETYGAIYTWAAAMNRASSSSANPSLVQGACPTGWHLPSDAEWKDLEMHLDMSQADADDVGWRGLDLGIGGALKETGTSHWTSPNTGASNSSGFTALPSGYRNNDNGEFRNIGNNEIYWSTSETSSTGVMIRHLIFDRSEIYRGAFAKSFGLSVRCVED